MTLPRYTGVTVQTTTNAPAPAATVTVYQHNTNIPADLFSDEAGTTPLANPLTSDAVTGIFTFCVANGLYDLTVTGVALTPYTIPGVQLVYQGAPVGQLFIISSTFTHADLLAWPTTPLTLVAAPGVGRTLVPLVARLVVDTTAAPYANIDPGTVPSTGATINIHTVDWSYDLFSYLVNGYAGGTLVNTGQTLVTQFLGGAGQQRWQPLPFAAGKDPADGATTPFFVAGWGLLGDPTIADATAAQNQALVAAFSNGALGNLTGGDPANGLTATVAYLVL